MSIVVPSSVSGSIESITTRTALGVARAVESLGVGCAIKWVNDIYVDSRKAVGILCEGVMSMEDHALHEVVIGIGVNYTTPPSLMRSPPSPPRCSLAGMHPFPRHAMRHARSARS